MNPDGSETQRCVAKFCNAKKTSKRGALLNGLFNSVLVYGPSEYSCGFIGCKTVAACSCAVVPYHLV